MPVVIVIVVVLVLLALGGIVGFNRLRTQNVGVNEALGGIDVQLTRRADLIPNLVNTVKGYAAHESGVFEAVTEARARVQKAASDGTVGEKAAAAEALDKALVNVMAVAENYPELKASANFLDLQKQLTDTENQLSFARQFYNDAVAKLNTSVSTFPWMLFSGVASVAKRDFYEAPATADAPPDVQF